MFVRTHTLRRITVVIVATSLAIWAAAPALPFDGRSPDAREAGEQAKPSLIVNGRSPDSRDAGQRIASALSDAWVGAFSARPDPGASSAVADAWLGMLSARPQPEIPAAEVGSIDRFHWGDFGIGVGVTLGLMLLVAGLAASALVARQKRDAKTGATTT
ncbi:MAG TPA: hypothetical protein VHF67_06180 [Gaiellaceae bacterium]|nr:hypothetical protein [Gaiellaceae bacterium]